MKLLNELLGTKYPIIQGGMANIATGEFAAACSNAGALGLIGAGGMNADTLRQNIRRCKELTDKPFGVNIMLMHPQADELALIFRHDVVRAVLGVQVVRDILDLEARLRKLLEREVEERAIVRLEVELARLLEQAAVLLEEADVREAALRMALLRP